MAGKVHGRAWLMSLRPLPAYSSVNAAAANDSPYSDRRRRPRLRVHWPVLFRAPGPVIETVTQDLSSDGFYCKASSPFVPGEICGCTLSLPAYHLDDLVRVIPVQCQIRVVRVEALAESGLFGIGCRIEDYRVQFAPAGR